MVVSSFIFFKSLYLAPNDFNATCTAGGPTGTNTAARARCSAASSSWEFSTKKRRLRGRKPRDALTDHSPSGECFSEVVNKKCIRFDFYLGLTS